MDHREIITDALRSIGVVAKDEPAQADDYAVGKAALDALFAELQTSPGMVWADLTVDTIPDAFRIPLGHLLGCDLAPMYGASPVSPRATAMIRLRAVQNVYVRDMDYNKDGTTTQAEMDAFDRGAYY